MARRWTTVEEEWYRQELQRLYIHDNKTILQISNLLGIAEGSVYDRLLRLGIPTSRKLKVHVNNQRSDVTIPERSTALAELLGILLGDGHISHFQVMVTLGSKERHYARHVRLLMKQLFRGVPKIMTSVRGYSTVYLGSTMIVKWLKDQGLVQNKVLAQVDVPAWIFEDRKFIGAFVRGFFDTDGSVYKLRYGIQISFCNRSMALLISLQKSLRTLGYSPSAISGYNLYLTKKADVRRFFEEIVPANMKHIRRYKSFAAPVV